MLSYFCLIFCCILCILPLSKHWFWTDDWYSKNRILRNFEIAADLSTILIKHCPWLLGTCNHPESVYKLFPFQNGEPPFFRHTRIFVLLLCCKDGHIFFDIICKVIFIIGPNADDVGLAKPQFISLQKRGKWFLWLQQRRLNSVDLFKLFSCSIIFTEKYLTEKYFAKKYFAEKYSAEEAE